MLFVPVVSTSGKPLMPCHPARARELIRKGKAIRQFDRGLFFIRLTARSDGVTQDVVVGIDPGSKKEGITVKSEAHTYLNIQADAVTHVKEAKADQAASRRARRFRKTPCRQPRANRTRGGLPPSTKARWQWKLRLLDWLRRLFPITQVVVENIKAQIKGKPRWDTAFSPLEVGKQWFYDEVRKLVSLDTFEGYETKQMRDNLGLKKTKKKMADVFEAHCVDSWVLANAIVGGHANRTIRGSYACRRSRSIAGSCIVASLASEGCDHPTEERAVWGSCGFDRSSSQVWHRLRRRCFGRTNQSPSRGRR